MLPRSRSIPALFKRIGHLGFDYASVLYYYCGSFNEAY